MKLIYTNTGEMIEHYTISLSLGEGCSEIILYEYAYGEAEAFYNGNTCVVGAMKDALLRLYPSMDSVGEFARESIIEAHKMCEQMAEGMASPWLQAKAYALCLEDDGWHITYEVNGPPSKRDKWLRACRHADRAGMARPQGLCLHLNTTRQGGVKCPTRL